MMQYEPVIGLEVHVELNTKTKMFCACSADYFGKKPNSHMCPVCLGLPGALPFINQEAIEKCIKIGLALNCSVAKESLFERKNYFYPDLAKGYQISQYRWPLCIMGSIEVTGKNGIKKTIRINRAHQEEDTGKLTHAGSKTLIDFNRSGIPLVEIVTEPDFSDIEQIRDYAKQLQQIFRNLGVSNADMEKGDMRLEANVSVRPIGQKELPPYRVELKNINSFRFMGYAVEYEIERQTKELKVGKKLDQETRGWNESKRETYLQRSKEEANDYRYFPEPDLPKLMVSDETVNRIRSTITELPKHLEQKYISWGMSANSAATIARSNERSRIFESAVQSVTEDKRAKLGSYFANLPITIRDPKELINQFNAKIGSTGKQTSKSEIKAIVEGIISENPNIVADYKIGKTNAIQVLIGKVMQKTQGRANANHAREILESLLK